MSLLLLGITTITRVELGNNKNPNLKFLKGTVLGAKEEGVGKVDKGQGINLSGVWQWRPSFVNIYFSSFLFLAPLFGSFG